jgi:Flp pilus assembly pilin Flp
VYLQMLLTDRKLIGQKKFRKKCPPSIGQGLVEYALILSLVAIVVLAILALFGPSIGSIFSNVNTSLGSRTPQVAPTAVPTPSWIFCAAENGTCTFPGTKTIRYGASGVYVTLVLTNTTPCTNGVFGDPLYGTVKACYYWGP